MPHKTSMLMLTLISTVLLSACGGSGGSAPSSSPVYSTPLTEVLPPVGNNPPADANPPLDNDPPADNIPPADIKPPADTKPPTDTKPPVDTKPPTDSDNVGKEVVTNIRFEGTSGVTQTVVPVTFGQVFAKGDLDVSHTVAGKLTDGTLVPLQVNVKARHADGSVRHAIISAKLGNLVAGQSQILQMMRVAAAADAAPTAPTALLNAGFTSNVSAKIGGAIYTASADALLRSGNYKTWLSGPVVNEWQVSAPLQDVNGHPHPHLSARFDIRAFTGTSQARVDVTVENNWAYEPAPQNFVYDAQVNVGGKNMFTKTAMTHYHHARWRKVFWWGDEPSVHAKHNVGYLLASRALPNFDTSVTFTEPTLASWKTAFSGVKTEPMNVGLAMAAMGTTGGRPDIGLLPAWTATYLLSMDKRPKDATLGTADLAGSWSSHYRDRATDRPVSLASYPYMTILGNKTDTYNPATRKQEAFPDCATPTACETPYQHDEAHQPAFAYLPYLVTGDYYYLEELQFWAMWDTFVSNPGYRENGKGLLKSGQPRGQAWSMRTVGEAAYITPDADPLKPQLTGFVNNTLDWYNANYTNNASTNAFGAMTHGYAMAYNNGAGLAPWMDDFITSAVGHLNELGFDKARALLQWKAKFPILRMTAPGTCWISGAIYSLNIRSSINSPYFTTMEEAYKASVPAAVLPLACNSSAMANAWGLRVGEMTGYSSSNTGFPSNMQPALAYAADIGGSAGADAWRVFMARSVKPDYGMGPQFAIVPR